MNVRRLFVLAVVALLSMSSVPSHAADKVFASGTLDGIFVSFEMGDYGHLNMKDSGGKEQSFFVLHPDKVLADCVDHPERYKGKRIRVKWQDIETNIPESGGKMRLKEAVSLKVLTP